MNGKAQTLPAAAGAPVLTSALATMTLAVVWGANWPAMKLALDAGISPLWLAAARFVIGATCLLPAMVIARGSSFVARGDVAVLLGGALGPMAAFTMLSCLALVVLPAGPSAVVAYATPLWVIPAAWWLLGERPGRTALGAAALGVVGLCLLSGPWALDWSDPRVPLGQMALLAASAAWAASIVQVRGRGGILVTPLPVLVFWQLVLAAALLVPIAAAFEPLPDTASLMAALPPLLYVGAAGTALAFLLMLEMNRRLSASAMAMATLGVPVAGLLLAGLLLGERPAPLALAGASLVIAAVVLGAAPARALRSSHPGDTP
jgi:drug/metabolite transporter (DMT)-like permease